ncbi:MAG: outer membrane beta-barrel family protein [Candidatus Cryptobacteroides sp.]
MDFRHLIRRRTARSYIDFFPTVFVGFNPSEKWRLSASYTRRINRPGYFYLNPTITYLDAHTWTLGNPDILPEISDNVYLSVGFGNHLSLTAGYTHLSNWIMQKPNVSEKGDQYLEWDNLGTNNNAFAAFNVSALKIFKWLDWTLNVSGVYMNTFSKELDYNTESLFASLYSCFTFILPKDWKMELDGNYTSPMKMGFYVMSPQWHVDFALKKQLLDNRLTLSCNINDIFRSSRADVDMNSVDNGTAQNSWSFLTQKFYVQKVRIGLSWNFGKAQQPMRQRNVGNLEEASRGASAKGIGK